MYNANIWIYLRSSKDTKKKGGIYYKMSFTHAISGISWFTLKRNRGLGSNFRLRHFFFHRIYSLGKKKTSVLWGLNSICNFPTSHFLNPQLFVFPAPYGNKYSAEASCEELEQRCKQSVKFMIPKGETFSITLKYFTWTKRAAMQW